MKYFFFLYFRQQRVVVNGVKTDWAPVSSFVPQGTVLAHLLFSVFAIAKVRKMRTP